MARSRGTPTLERVRFPLFRPHSLIPTHKKWAKDITILYLIIPNKSALLMTYDAIVQPLQILFSIEMNDQLAALATAKELDLCS